MFFWQFSSFFPWLMPTILFLWQVFSSYDMNYILRQVITNYDRNGFMWRTNNLLLNHLFTIKFVLKHWFYLHKHWTYKYHCLKRTYVISALQVMHIMKDIIIIIIIIRIIRVFISTNWSIINSFTSESLYKATYLEAYL